MEKVKNTLLIVITILNINYSFAQHISDTTFTLKPQPIKISRIKIQTIRNYHTIHIFKQRIKGNGIGQFYSFPDSLADGTWLCYYKKDSLQLAFVLHYKNGTLNGTAILYYLDGTSKALLPYKEGKLNGLSICFVKDYNPFEYYSIGYYKNNLHIGDWKSYYLNGALFTSTIYNKNGKIQKRLIYNKNGKIIEKNIFDVGGLKKSISWNWEKKTTHITLFENNWMKSKTYNSIKFIPAEKRK